MKHSFTTRLISIVLALLMVFGMLPLNTMHVHATESHSVDNEDTNLEIDYKRPPYKVDENGDPIYDENNQLIYLEPLQALSEAAESGREIDYTYNGKDLTYEDFYSEDYSEPQWRQVFKGDFNKLREWLESDDPDDRYIVLMEDIKKTIGSSSDWESINISSVKVLDLNGHTLELYDKSNGTKDQSSQDQDHRSVFFTIDGSGYTQGDDPLNPKNGALLTVIDSAGSNVTIVDPKGEIYTKNPQTGRIYANGYMINHQKWDFWYYTHRDVFHVLNGDLVIYGGEFQAGRQKDQFKSNFSWGKLKTIIGDAVTLGVAIYEYATGITAAEAARSDLMGGDMYKDLKEEIAGSDENEQDTGKTNNGATNKKQGNDDSVTKEKKTDTPTSKGEDAAKKDQTVAQKQNDKNSKGEDEAKKGGDSKENKAEGGKDAKPSKKDPTDSQIADANKAIGNAYLDKNKISAMVDGAIALGEGIYDMFAVNDNTRATACIHGTVARVAGGCTLVVYDGILIGHGSTPNVRDAVIEVYHNPVTDQNGRSLGGMVYVYGGTFTANTGANVFSMYEAGGEKGAVTYEYTTVESIDPVTGEDVYTSTLSESKPIRLAYSETFGVNEVRYQNLEKWQKDYTAIPEDIRNAYNAAETAEAKDKIIADYVATLAPAKREAAAKLFLGPEPVSTANIMIRGGVFRTYYEVSMMAVMDSSTRGSDKSDGQWCLEHEEYHGSNGGECDDVDYNKFTGTPGTVNLGVESFGEDMIKDGRIQLVDVYGQGKLVLLDGGDPIYENPEADPYEGMTEEEILAAEQEKREEEGEVTATPVNTYQTEGGFRQYRLYISDLELRAMQYLTVHPNTALTNSTNASFALKTYWGTGNSVAVDGWASDEDNIRAPYSSNENYFEYQFDAPEAQRGVYIMPELGTMNYDAAGEELAQSDVWYYNIPVNASGESLGNFQFVDTYMTGTYDKPDNPFGGLFGKIIDGVEQTLNFLLGKGTLANGEYTVSMNRLRKSGTKENTETYKDRLDNKDYYTVTDENYRTNIKFFVYRVYRVDPLSRENINESDTWAADEPLLEMRYGATNDSLKCKITLAELEKAIAEKKGDPDWGFRSGELYRVTFSVEEHLGYGYLGSQQDGEVEFVNHLEPARAESSILFRCVGINENKDGTHVNGSTGASGAGKVPDWTPLQFVKQDENGNYYKDETVSPGGYATVELLNGQTGIIDYEGARIFDVYYQWYILDDPNDTTPTLIAGTDDVWVAQNPYGGKQFHKPGMWALNEDGTGANGKIYASTVDPSSVLAAKYELNAYGMPVDQDDWIEEGYQMLHMYTYETCNAHPGMIKDPDQGGLYMANNNTFWGNTDSIYVPAEYAGKYLQCKLVAVNTRYPQVFDNLQTVESHIIPISGVAIPGFDQVAPAPLNGNEYGGYSKLGDVYKDTVPTFSFSALPLDEELRDQGYTLELLTIDKVDGETVATIYDGKPYTPKEYGEHELSMIINMVDAAGKRLNSLTQVYTFNLRFKPMFTKLSPNASKAELEAGVKDMGKTAVHTLTFEYEPLPQFMYDQGYRQYFRVDGTNTGSGNEVTVQEYENGAKVSLNGLYYNYSIKPVIELYNIHGVEVAETSITYKLSPTVGLCFTGLTPSVTAAQIANKVADLGTVYEPVTVSYDDVVIPSWVDSTVARLYSASMDVYRDGEHLDRYLFDRGEKSYTATVFGDYEIVLTQNIINAGGYHEETFTYKFTYAAPELKFTNLTPAPTAAEYEAGKKDLGLVSAPTVFSYELLTLTEQQIADGYKVRASMDIYDAEDNKVTGIGGTVNDNVFSYTHSLLGEYRIVLKQTLYCQVEEGGGVSYSESVEFEYTVNQTNDYLLAFTGFEPYQPTDEELAAGLTELGTIPGRQVFSFTHTTVPQWMLNNGYTIVAWIYDYQNGEQVGFGSNYPVSAGGDHELIAKAELLDPSGNVVQSISHKFTCHVVEEPATEINIHNGSGTPMEAQVVAKDTTVKLAAQVLPLEANQSVTWTSSNTKVATVQSNGTVRALKPGTAVITATDATGKISDSFILTVSGGTVYVGGVAMTEGQYLEQGSNWATTANPSGDSYACLYTDQETEMLTLALVNFTIEDYCLIREENTLYGCGIYTEEYIDIVIEGENSIIQKGPYAYYGIHQAGDGAVYSRYGDGSLYIETPGNGIENDSELWIYDCSITIRTGNHGINSLGAMTLENCAIDIESTSGNFNNMINCYAVVDIDNDANIRLVTTTPYSNALYAGQTIYVRNGASLYAEGASRGIYCATLIQQDSSITAKNVRGNGYPAIEANSVTLAQTAFAIEHDGYALVEYDAANNGAYHYVIVGTPTNVITLNGAVLPVDHYMYSSDTLPTTSWDWSREEGYLHHNNYNNRLNLTSSGYNNPNAELCIYDLELWLDGSEDLTIGQITGTGSAELNVIGDGDLIIHGTSLNGVTVDSKTHTIDYGTDTITISHKHNMIHTERIPATCTEDGVPEYYHCTVCERYFKDAAGTEETWDTIEWSHGHDYEGGCTTPSICKVCGYYGGDAQGHEWSGAYCWQADQCWRCGEVRGEALPCAMTEETTTSITEATCSQEGLQIGWCWMCGQEMEVVLPKAAHNYTEGTCAAPGTCTMCGIENTETVQHVLDEGVVTKQPNCTEEGVLTKTCSICGSTVEEPIAIDGDVHTYADATCTAPRTCTGCGITEGVKLTHNLNEGVVTKAPTCSAEGILKRTCSDCGETVEEAIPMTDHNITSMATCSEPAKCGDCGLYIGLALAHNWVDATCGVPQTCANCGATEGYALEHDWIDATCDHPKFCTNCGDTEGSALGHSWKAATCSDPKTCTTCWATEGKKLGHTWDVNDCTAPGTCTVCSITREAGDHSVSFTSTDIQMHSGICDSCGATVTQKHYYGGDEFCDDCGYEHTHSLTHIPAKDATCTTTGNVEYWSCSACGMTFSDEAGTTEITEIVIPENGHSWNEATCITPKTCSVCGETEGEALGHNMVDGTCTRCGYTEAVGGPQIVSQPSDYVGALNSMATFTVKVNVTDVTYQWYYSNDGITWNKSGSTGSTTDTLSIKVVDYRLGQLYRCEITDSNGNIVVSNEVTMKLPASTIVINNHPADYLGAPNDTVTFTVEATGLNITYQWYYSNNGGETWSRSYSEGFNTASLSPILREYRSGQMFRCLITDGNGNTQYTNAAVMALKTSEINIVTQPESYTGKLNDLVEFTVEAEGENLKYLWYYSSDNGATWVQTYNSGYNTPTVQVRLYAYRSGWQFKCVITSGNVITKETDVVTIAKLPTTVKIVTQPMNMGGPAGSTVQFHVAAEGTGLTYQWQYSNNGGTSWGNTSMSGYNTDTLSVGVVAYRDGYQYRCIVTDHSGVSLTSSVATLRVGDAPVITSQPMSYVGAVDTTATFAVVATGANLTYQWQFSNDNGVNWSNSGAAGAKTSSLDVVLKSYRNGQMYRCVITNEYGSVISDAVSLTIG